VVGASDRKGSIGAELLRNCLRIAKQREINTIWGQVLAENTQMLSLGKKLGFDMKRNSEPNAFELRIDLDKIGTI
jgi:acetyltransferase